MIDGNMFGMLTEARKKMEEAKDRLKTISVCGESENGKVKVMMTANKKVTNVTIDNDFYNEADKEDIEDLLLTSVNRAIEQAEKVAESELKSATSGVLPNIPGLW